MEEVIVEVDSGGVGLVDEGGRLRVSCPLDIAGGGGGGWSFRLSPGDHMQILCMSGIPAAACQVMWTRADVCILRPSRPPPPPHSTLVIFLLSAPSCTRHCHPSLSVASYYTSLYSHPSLFVSSYTSLPCFISPILHFTVFYLSHPTLHCLILYCISSSS